MVTSATETLDGGPHCKRVVICGEDDMTDCPWDFGIDNAVWAKEKAVSNKLTKLDPPEERLGKVVGAWNGDADASTTVCCNDDSSRSTMRSVPRTIYTSASDTNSTVSRLSKGSFYFRRPAAWEDIEDDLAILLQNDESILNLFKSVFEAGMKDRPVLLGLGYLVGEQNRTVVSVEYTDAISNVAQYLAKQSFRCRDGISILSLACIRLFVILRSPIEAGWQCEEPVLLDTASFVTGSLQTWPNEYPSHSDEIILWEIRAICTSFLAKWRAEECRRKAWIEASSQTAADALYTTSHVFSRALGHSSTLVASEIANIGDMTKSLVDPHDEPPVVSDEQLARGEATRAASERVRCATEKTVMMIKEASSKGAEAVASKSGEWGAKVVPHRPSREIIAAAGKVGWATLGAAAVTAEAIVESTQTVTKATLDATADVAQHRYGPAAGQLVVDVSETANNVLRTAGHIALVSGTSWTQSVAKKSAKDNAHAQCPTKLAASRRSKDCNGNSLI